MKINFKILLFAPSMQIQIGGVNPVLAECVMEHKLTPEILRKIWERDFIKIKEEIRCWICGYTESENLLLCKGNLPDLGYAEKLEQDGWTVRWENFRPYELSEQWRKEQAEAETDK